jgi:hypothetical protein
MWSGRTRGEKLVPVAELFEIVRSLHHGHASLLVVESDICRHDLLLEIEAPKSSVISRTSPEKIEGQVFDSLSRHRQRACRISQLTGVLRSEVET